MCGAALGGLGGVLGSGAPDREFIAPPIADPGGLEKLGFGVARTRFQDLMGYTDLGPGGTDITQALEARRGLAATLGNLAQTGLVPTAADITQGQTTAEALSSPQRVAMEQAFRRQGLEAQRTSQRLGRGPSDPLIQAKLAQSRLESQERMGASQGALAQRLAMLRPEQRLQLQSRQADVLGGLATQAMQNRMSLLSLGHQLGQAERQFRLQRAGQHRMVESPSTMQRIGAGLSGAIGGAGAGLGIAQGMSALGGARTAAAPMTSAASMMQSMPMSVQAAQPIGVGANSFQLGSMFAPRSSGVSFGQSAPGFSGVNSNIFSLR